MTINVYILFFFEKFDNFSSKYFFRLRLLSKPGLWLILSINTSDDGSLVSHITRVTI